MLCHTYPSHAQQQLEKDGERKCHKCDATHHDDVVAAVSHHSHTLSDGGLGCVPIFRVEISLGMRVHVVFVIKFVGG